MTIRKRSRHLTAKVTPLPAEDDPLWRLGHGVVQMIAEYLDRDESALGVDRV